MKKSVCLFVLLFLSFFLSCKENFEPYADLRKGFLMYCVLDNRFDSQLVLLQRIHNPNTDKKMPKDTKVFLSENGGQNYYFRDTVITGYDDYSCYYLPNYALKRGTTYKVVAFEDSLNFQSGEILYCKNPALVINESREARHLTYDCAASDYYTYQMYLEYEYEEYGKKELRMIKVPGRLYDTEDEEYNVNCWSKYDKQGFIALDYPGDYVYKNSQIPSGATLRIGKAYYEYSAGVFYYLGKFYFSFLDFPSSVVIKRLFLVYYSFDKNMYEKETAVSHASYSLRLGEALYWSNIKKSGGDGYGFIGAVASDTVFTYMDSTIINKYHLQDGQKYK